MKRLRALRKLHGMTQTEVADKICVERSTYGKYETGQAHPPIPTLQKLASLFSVSIDELIAEDDDSPDSALQNAMDIPNNIRSLRTERGILQADLAKALGISQAALSGYESGKFQADISTYIQIADYFDVTLDYLLNNRISPPKTNINHLRSLLGIKQSDLAKQLHVQQGTISNWEADKTEPDIASLKKLAEIFGVSVGTVLGVPEPKPAESTAPAASTASFCGLSKEEMAQISDLGESIQNEIRDFIRFKLSIQQNKCNP